MHWSYHLFKESFTGFVRAEKVIHLDLGPCTVMCYFVIRSYGFRAIKSKRTHDITTSTLYNNNKAKITFSLKTKMTLHYNTNEFKTNLKNYQNKQNGHWKNNSNLYLSREDLKYILPFKKKKHYKNGFNISLNLHGHDICIIFNDNTINYLFI